VTASEEAGVPVLRARGVRVERPGARSRVLRRRMAPTRVIQDLDVEVTVGDLLWVVGAPGEGGAEVGQVLAGELSVASGVVELNGRALAASRGRRRTRTERQVVRIDADATVRLDPRRTALEVVAAAAAGSTRSVTSEHLTQGRDLLAGLGLDADSSEQRTASLSAADARLVEAARVLAPRPRAVVYQASPRHDRDVDPVWGVLTGLRETASLALVVTSEVLPAELDPRSRVLVMCGGRVVEVLRDGDLTHPLHPYTLTLLGADRTTSRAPGASGPSDAHARDADDACPFRMDCPRAKARCGAERPRLARPLGATHEVACHFPEDPRRPASAASVGGTAPALDGGAPGGRQAGSDEPTAREFADG
jgi:ABC-type glutathione transport system ATPase component